MRGGISRARRRRAPGKVSWNGRSDPMAGASACVRRRTPSKGPLERVEAGNEEVQLVVGAAGHGIDEHAGRKAVAVAVAHLHLVGVLVEAVLRRVEERADGG